MQRAVSSLLGEQKRYLVVARSLLKDIQDGRYAVGGLLPAEGELCRQYAVSRHTIREALRRLVEIGVIERSQGVGTRIVSRNPRVRYVQSVSSLADLTQYARKTRLVVTSVRDVIAEGDLCELLACKEGQRWVEVNALRYSGSSETPMAVSKIYLPAEFAALAARIGATHKPVYEQIEQQYGETVAEVEQAFGAVAIVGEAARALNVKEGTPGMNAVRRYLGGHGQPLQVVLNTHLPMPDYCYSMRLNLDRAGKGN